MNEIWKSIEGYENHYEISNLGKVKSLARYSKYGQNNKDRILKHGLDGKGYHIVSLCKDQKKTTAKVHLLVAHAFILNSYNKPCINHKDGIKKHNCVYNLEWCTHSENAFHAYANNLKKGVNGEKHGNAKLKEVNILQIRASNLSSKDLSKIFKVSMKTIRNIKNNKSWRHL